MICMKKWLLLAGLAAGAALAAKKLLSVQEKDGAASVSNVILDEPDDPAGAPVETMAPPPASAAPPANLVEPSPDEPEEAPFTPPSA